MYNEIMMDVDGLIFDYGGTLDTNSVHWSEVLWKGYQNAGVPVTKDVFRDAYVHGERTLAKNHIIKTHHNFLDLLKIKVEIETGYLRDCPAWLVDEPKRLAVSDSIAEFCYKCDDFYHPNDEGGVAWNDPEIGIVWPRLGGSYNGTASAEGYTVDGTPLNLSEKDQKWLGLKDTFKF